jgi:hypothetical protein
VSAEHHIFGRFWRAALPGCESCQWVALPRGARGRVITAQRRGPPCTAGVVHGRATLDYSAFPEEWEASMPESGSADCLTYAPR